MIDLGELPKLYTEIGLQSTMPVADKELTKCEIL